MKTRTLAAALLASLTLAVTGIAPTMAKTPSTMSHAKMMHGKMMHGKKMASAKAVYVCTKCKQYYSPAQAKKMGYKDSMGHKLTRMAKVPTGYTAGGKMSSMHGKMMHGKMMHGKMMHSKM